MIFDFFIFQILRATSDLVLLSAKNLAIKARLARPVSSKGTRAGWISNWKNLFHFSPSDLFTIILNFNLKTWDFFSTYRISSSWCYFCRPQQMYTQVFFWFSFRYPKGASPSSYKSFGTHKLSSKIMKSVIRLTKSWIVNKKFNNYSWFSITVYCSFVSGFIYKWSTSAKSETNCTGKGHKSRNFNWDFIW